MQAVQLTRDAEQPHHRSIDLPPEANLESVPQRQPAPACQCPEIALGKILLETLGNRLCQIRINRLLIGLEIPVQRPVIEVA